MVTDYYLNGSAIVTQITGTDRMDFFYDDAGNLIGFSLNGTNYYYIRNAQSDIIGILDKDGNKVVNYVYDSWGKLLNISGSLATTVGSQNPFRYRGYYYDNETGYYYLQSRYYDPYIGRFLNADDTDILTEDQNNLLQHNLYAYCLNNPINMVDKTGYIAAAIAVSGSTFAAFTAWLSTLGAANFWNPVGWIIAGVLAAGVITWAAVSLYRQFQASQAQSQAQLKAKQNSITKSISNAVSKAKVKIRNERNRYDYWIASYVDYGGGRGAYIPTTPLSYSRAISYVRAGGNVFADSQQNAYRLALAVGYGRNPTRPEIHYDRNTNSSLGYWYHYHDGLRRGGHIFYV